MPEMLIDYQFATQMEQEENPYFNLTGVPANPEEPANPYLAPHFATLSQLDRSQSHEMLLE